jgi:plastocyanin
LKTLLLLTAIAAVLTACGATPAATIPAPSNGETPVAPAASATPAVQPAPEPTETPLPPAAEPAPPTANAPTPEPAPAPERPDAVTLNLRAYLLAFSPGRLTAPAGSRITLVLQNDDRNVPHDIGVRIPGGPTSTLCNGPCSTSISFTAPAPGSYQFYCPVHPSDMVGTLVITP